MQNLPVIDTQVGNVFEDRFDANRRWYLPDFALVKPPDTAFAFAATQGQVGPSGDPFDTAQLTIDLQTIDPADVTASRQQSPGATFSSVAFLSVDATLSVPVTANDGSAQTDTTQGQVNPQPDGTYRATFNLLGPKVITAYETLAHLGGATISVTVSYGAWKRTVIRRPIPTPPPGPGPHPSHLVTPVFSSRLQTMPMSAVSPVDSPQFDHVQNVDPPNHPIDWPPETISFYYITARASRTVQIGLAFATDAYRSRFTITASGATRPIIDATDLTQFATPRSEFQELTSLDLTRYPTIKHLYIGQVSGTVVAVPLAYGIVRGSSGCAARCDCAVDVSSITGCRFQFTFTLEPVIDPIDIAQLTHDLAAAPESANRSLRLTLPTGLDTRAPVTLAGFATATTIFSDGVDPNYPHSVLVSVGIGDTDTTPPIPAITNANLFLAELTSPGTTPLFATIAIHLDDAYPTPVETTANLNFHSTADSDDLTVVSSGSPPAQTVINLAPFDLDLRRFARYTPSGLTAATSLTDETLATGQSTVLPGDPTGTSGVLVSRTLALPVPLPPGVLFKDYLTLNTETVPDVQHPMTVNAIGAFGASGITELDVQITFSDPHLPQPPAMTLTPAHEVDSVDVIIPVDALVTGLAATLTITIMANTGRKQVTLTNDFLSEPIFILTSAALN